MTEEITKALEVWTLQNLLNFSIMLGILATGLAMVRGYFDSLEKRLSLRVSIELWRVFTILVVDILLVAVVLIGFLVLNPDIMSDIKMAVPFCPAATVMFAVALVLRLFHGGHELGSRNYFRSLWLMIAGSVVNMVGFSIVMEAPGREYLGRHPNPFWTYVKTHLRSNADPYGIELSQITFYVGFALLLAVFAWGVWSAMGHIRRLEVRRP